MKLWMKILIGIAIALVVLTILGNIGKQKTTTDSGTGVEPLPSAPSNNLADLQSELNILENQINALESEDLGGLE